MDRLKLYHGSDHIIERPVFGFGKSDNDYGSGFYTTEVRERAEEWAVLYGSGNAVVNCYTLDTDGLNIFDLDSSGPLAWIAEVISNRGVSSVVAKSFAGEFVNKYKPNTEHADMITGYRADDSYGDVIEAFLSGELTIEEVQRLFWKGELGRQVFIKSERAFDRLTFVGHDKPQNDLQAGERIIKARQDVIRFIQNRRIQIAKRFIVPEISIVDALANHYIYHVENGYYESR